MNNKFISFADTLINTKYIKCFEKRRGINNYDGIYYIKVFIEGHPELNELFNSKEERDDRYLELKNILKADNYGSISNVHSCF